MTWQDRYIASTDDALALIRNQAAEVAKVDPERLRFAPPKGKQIITKRRIDFDLKDGFKNILFLTIERGSRSDFNFTNMFVGKDYGGNSLGRVMVKAILGMAHEAGASAIRLVRLIDKGPPFWQGLAGLPIEPPVNLSQRILDRLEIYGPHLSGTEEAQWERIARTSRERPYPGWLDFAKTASDRGMRDDVLGHFCENRSLVLLPGVPAVRAVLEEKLGVLPPFRPPGSRSEYRHIAAELA